VDSLKPAMNRRENLFRSIFGSVRLSAVEPGGIGAVSEKKAFNVGPSGVDIASESFGDPSAPPVLLIMGVGGR
jgi:hypothetical protein